MKNIFVVLALCLFSCANLDKSMESENSTSNEIISPVVPAPDLALKVPLATDTRIRKADYSLEVKDAREFTTFIENTLQGFTGYIEDSKLVWTNGYMESTMTIRIEASHFDAFLREVDSRPALVRHRNISSSDVGKEFVDLESRLRTKRELEQRYIAILRSKAGTIEELLSAEKQIGILHEEIEATISRLNYLKDQVKYSTITLRFYQPSPDGIVLQEDGYLQRMGTALSGGLNGLGETLLILANIWPLLVMFAVIYFFIRIRRKRLTPGT